MNVILLARNASVETARRAAAAQQAGRNSKAAASQAAKQGTKKAGKVDAQVGISQFAQPFCSVPGLHPHSAVPHSLPVPVSSVHCGTVQSPVQTKERELLSDLAKITE